MIFARKIYKIPEFYMIFARKMPEFYVIIARKNIFPRILGGHVPPPPSPRLLRLWRHSEARETIIAGPYHIHNLISYGPRSREETWGGVSPHHPTMGEGA